MDFENLPRGLPNTSDTDDQPPRALWSDPAAVSVHPNWQYSTDRVLLGLADGKPVGVDDDRHLLTIAGSRAGKGRSAIVPNLLLYTGSVLVIDPKGENAKLTAERRGKGRGVKTGGLGQDVFVIDPFKVSGVAEDYLAGFNPLAGLNPHSDDFIDECDAIADALVEVERPAIERWHEALLNAEGLVADVEGHEDDEQFVRDMLVQGLEQRDGTDPMLLKALRNPKSAPPDVTVKEAATVYAKDKGLNKNELVRFERILRRLEDAVGALDKVNLVGLRRTHGRQYMEHLLACNKSDGAPLSLGTCKREATIVSAFVTHGMIEFDLKADVTNPFVSLPWPQEDIRSVEKKLPLPDKLVFSVEKRLATGRTTDLLVIWRLLKSTGARLGEIVGLEIQDIVLESDVPHLLIRPNGVRRRLKTKASTRSVPLVGDAFNAAQEALKSVESGSALFSRYARERGADAASAAIMKALRQETDEKKMTTHGLRHRVSDKLRDIGAPVEVRHGFLAGCRNNL
jgi:integrase